MQAVRILGLPTTRNPPLLFSYSFPSPPCRHICCLVLAAPTTALHLFCFSTISPPLLWQLPAISSTNSSSSSPVSTAHPRSYLPVGCISSPWLLQGTVAIIACVVWASWRFVSGQILCPHAALAFIAESERKDCSHTRITSRRLKARPLILSVARCFG